MGIMGGMKTATTTKLLPARVQVEFGGDKFATVSPIWAGVDRPNVGGISVPLRFVGRVVAALESGAAFESTKVVRDIDGKTYVEASSRIMGRHLERSLRAIGY
jgi:hypothetical protein